MSLCGVNMDELVCRYQRPYTLTTDSLEKATGREILFYYIAGIFFFFPNSGA